VPTGTHDGDSESSARRSTRVLAVVGPTAVGKTAVAEEIAVRLGGEIISADSMQVYRGMNVGTAKPFPEERRVHYHCIDLAEPGEPFSAALFQREARAAIDRVAHAGKQPVVAGGTGLYVRAALDDLEFPAGEQAGSPVRERWEQYAAEHGALALHAELVRLDPESAALIHPNNTRRVVRAFELLEEGTTYSQQHAGLHERRSVYDSRFVGLTMERAALYSRIDERVDKMIDRGLVEEVRCLLDCGLESALTARQAIGYKEIVPVLQGRASLSEAIDAIKQASRRYAKRQLTWFRADPRIVWVDVTELSTAAATDAALAALDCNKPA
jgi:tRNA dimethylallyltransferase